MAGIERFRQKWNRFKLADADQYIEPLLEYLGAAKGIQKLDVAGSYRRRKETVGDIDLLAAARNARPVMRHFTAYPKVKEVRSAGETRSTVILKSGLQVDLRIVPPKSYGAALVYFTGSKEHNIALRQRAVKRGLRISEYGVFRIGENEPPEEKPKGSERGPWAGEMIAGRTEQEVYESVDLPWIAPELRENQGEIDAAEKGELPHLIELGDLRGDLQMHSTWSDGVDSLEEMVKGCLKRGYEYMAITDHGKALPMVRGLKAERLREQWKEIAELREKYPQIRILRSMEIDILEDGTLDLEDTFLERLDLVLVSIHSKLNLSSSQQTKRILKAIQHPGVHILAHPTGRLINQREPMDFSLDEVLACAAENNVAVELNAHPDRLDLKDVHLMEARKRGVKIVINTDAHRVEDLALISYGIDQARRAWLTKMDVLNTLPVERLLETVQGRMHGSSRNKKRRIERCAS